MATSMFDFLEPKKEPVKVPYRPPEEMNGSIVANLKPGETKTIIPKSKAPVVKQKLTYTGGKGQVGKTVYPTKQDVEFEPMTVTAPVGEKKSPDVTDQELEEIMPPPKKPLEEQIAETVKGKPHVEAKQERNDIVQEDQKKTTQEVVDDDSAWDDIWPALIPIATNALLGDGTYDVAFNEAANVIDKVRKEKLAFAKAEGKGKAGGLSLNDRMLLAEQKIEGQKELKTMDIGGKKELKGVDLDNKLVQMRSAHGSKIIEQQYRDMGLDNRQIEKYKMTPVDIQDPATGKPKAMSAFEYFSLPLNERPQRVPKATGGSSRLIAENFTLNNKKMVRYRDPISGDVVKVSEGDVGDTSPISNVSLKQFKTSVAPLEKPFSEEVTAHADAHRDMTRIISMIESDNIYEVIQAVNSTIKKIEGGRMTDQDRETYTTPLSYWDKTLAEIAKQKNGTFPVKMREGFKQAMIKTISDTRDAYERLGPKYTQLAKSSLGQLPYDEKEVGALFVPPKLHEEKYETLKSSDRKKQLEKKAKGY